MAPSIPVTCRARNRGGVVAREIAWYGAGVPPNARLSLVLSAFFVTLLGATACTETPSWFPPCVNGAPCPDLDADDDGSEASDAGALPEASDADDASPVSTATDAAVGDQ
jgi:hypothetical protein